MEFRIFNKTTNQYEYYEVNNTESMIKLLVKHHNDLGQEDLIEYWTGTKDMDGVRIYENDTIEFDGFGDRVVIIFAFGAFGYENNYNMMGSFQTLCDANLSICRVVNH